ncbi:winged helix-turn-helix domain-containing protein [Kitasatospora nipponensis]|uniref:Winged helix-turn-helix domain-containing protein n=1 Tax=Kitasatospora nipponensis TaxID=258049 RepID=A0ABN1W582_9ACTN
MGLWLVDTDTLAGSRFVVSPLAETVACVKVLQSAAAAHPGERDWLAAQLPSYRERLAGDPVTALLIRIGLGRPWNADFLTLPPQPPPAGSPAGNRDGERTFAREVARIRDTAPEAARADLARSMDGALPAQLDRADLPERAADLLTWVWTHAVLPSWPQRRRVIEADVIARTAQLSRGGWAAALNDLRPNTRWLGDGRLRINAHDYPDRELPGVQLMFVPVTPKKGWVSWETPPVAGEQRAEHRYAMVYPCAGALAEAGRTAAPEALGRLLGTARAGVLVLLDSPKSTTQLVALTGQPLGSVGRHLKVLLDARLVQRRRAGRSVLYFRTAAGETLLRAQET